MLLFHPPGWNQPCVLPQFLVHFCWFGSVACPPGFTADPSRSSQQAHLLPKQAHLPLHLVPTRTRCSSGCTAVTPVKDDTGRVVKIVGVQVGPVPLEWDRKRGARQYEASRSAQAVLPCLHPGRCRQPACCCLHPSGPSCCTPWRGPAWGPASRPGRLYGPPPCSAPPAARGPTQLDVTDTTEGLEDKAHGVPLLVRYDYRMQASNPWLPQPLGAGGLAGRRPCHVAGTSLTGASCARGLACTESDHMGTCTGPAPANPCHPLAQRRDRSVDHVLRRRCETPALLGTFLPADPQTRPPHPAPLYRRSWPSPSWMMC